MFHVVDVINTMLYKYCMLFMTVIELVIVIDSANMWLLKHEKAFS